MTPRYYKGVSAVLTRPAVFLTLRPASSWTYGSVVLRRAQSGIVVTLFDSSLIKLLWKLPLLGQPLLCRYYSSHVLAEKLCITRSDGLGLGPRVFGFYERERERTVFAWHCAEVTVGTN